MQYKCGLTINNEATDSCKECKYNVFENREECFDRQEYAMEQMVSDIIPRTYKELPEKDKGNGDKL